MVHCQLKSFPFMIMSPELDDSFIHDGTFTVISIKIVIENRCLLNELHTNHLESGECYVIETYYVTKG